MLADSESGKDSGFLIQTLNLLIGGKGDGTLRPVSQGH